MKMKQLENRAQEFWFKLIDSEAIKDGIDLLTTLVGVGTNFVDLLDKTQLTLPSIIGALGSFGISKFGEGSLD